MLGPGLQHRPGLEQQRADPVAIPGQHAAQPTASTPTEQVLEDGLGLVVFMVTGGDDPALASLQQPTQGRPPGLARPRCQAGTVAHRDLQPIERQPQSCGLPTHPGHLSRGLGAEAMVDGGDLQTGAMGCLQVRQDLHQHSAVESPTHRDDHPLTRLPEPLSADDLQHAQRQSAGTVVEPSPCFHRQRTRRPRQLSNIEVNGDVIVGMGPATPLLATLAAAIPHDDLAMVSGQRDRVVEAATCRRTVSGHVVDVQAAQAAGTVVAHPGTSAGHVGTAVLAGEGCVALDGVGAHPAGSLSISQGPHESLSGPVGVHLLAAAVQLRLQDGALVGILINLQPQPLDGAA